MSKTKVKRKQSKISKFIAQCSSHKVRSGRSMRIATHKEKQYFASRLLFSNFSATEIAGAFRAIDKQKLFKGLTRLSLVRPSDQTFRPMFFSGDIRKNIAWAGQVCINNSEVLQDFIRYEEQITEYLLAGGYDNAVSSINSLLESSGYSYWAHCLYSGVIAQDKGVNIPPHPSLNIDCKENQFLYFIVKYGCAYYQDEDIFFTLTETDRKVLLRWVDDIKFVCEYYVLPRTNMEYIDFEYIFSAVKNSSVVDIYHSLIRYITQVAVRNPDQILEPYFEGIVNDLSGDIDDYVLENAGLMLGKTAFNNDSICEDLINIYEFYDNGLYDEVIKYVSHKNSPFNDFDVFEVVVRSNIRARKMHFDGLLLDISVAMEILILRGDDYHKAKQQLAFIAYSFRSLRWFEKLSLFLDQEGEFLSGGGQDLVARKVSMLQKGHSSRKENIFGGEYISFLIQKYKNLKSIQVENDLENRRQEKFTLNTAPLALSMMKIRSKINLGREIEVIENLYLIIEKNEDPQETINAKRMLIDCLIETGRSEIAISIFVGECINNINYASIYDVEVIAACAAKDFKTSKSIDYPICLSIFSRTIGTKYDSHLKFSFELFLTKNGFGYPEELFTKKWKGCISRSHYFLKWVCTQETMSLYIGFSKPRDIEDCRLNVCSRLISLGDSSDYLTNEILEINKKKVARLAEKRVNKSRIHVDTSVFSGRKSDQFKILFDRYLSFNSTGLSEDSEMFESIIAGFQGKDEIKEFYLSSVLSSLHLPDVNLSKKNATFLSLCKLFREFFTYGEKGLNNHLSTRIRHGVLPSAYQKPFAGEGLLISVVEKNHSSLPGARDYPEVLGLLKEFTDDYQRHILEINDGILQIRALDSSAPREKNLSPGGRGKFDYSISAVESYMVQKALPISPKFDDLVKVMVAWLWDRTDHNLKAVRAVISGESQGYIVGRLEKLKYDISKLEIPQSIISDICNAISRSRSKLPAQIETMCSWFHRSDGLDESGVYELVTAIELARDSLSLCADISDLAKCRISGKSLSYFVDIFHILFENAISKSGLSRDGLDIRVSISKEESKYKITITNLVDQDFPSKIDLDFYQGAYGDEALINDVLQQEGGTGLFKIWKILDKDLGIPHDANIRFKNEDEFEVTFNLCSCEAIFDD